MMPTEDHYMLVEFGKYCKTCEHEKVLETKVPCSECMECPARINSSRPLKWEPKNKKK